MIGAKKAVAIGGGTGLPLVLRCLVRLGHDATAIVTMADDGGSSGALRRQLGMLPPGDARNCLVALSPEGGELSRLFQYRFRAGEGLAGHSLGNLMIAALSDIEGGFPEALGAAGRLIGARGTVLPSTLADVVLEAVDASGEHVIGQALVARSEGPIRQARLTPPSPPAYPPALDAVREADAVVIGPGSLFTSIIPNMLVEGMAEALRECRGRVIYVCNVANQRGETTGMDAAAHIDALVAHGLSDVVDVAVVHAAEPVDGDAITVDGSAGVRERIEALGIRVLAAALDDTGNPMHHDEDRLCEALGEVL